MTVATTGKTLGTTEGIAVEDLPIDVEAISSRTESVLAMKMGTSTRKDMDGVVPTIVGHLNLLLCEDLGVDEDQEVRGLVRKGYTLIDDKNRPTGRTPSFGVFLYLRDIALLTRRLLWIYTERNGLGAP
ncbi:hypothetical protein [Streptomyces sp. GS7]|uniref:hypothetical protein n=1 Tax=Streptomyces sp. GS7 TaxID=2692234 RepID=UPI001F1FED47|nr:hypothetical protein [Streptomyces sp. GS7]